MTQTDYYMGAALLIVNVIAWRLAVIADRAEKSKSRRRW